MRLIARSSALAVVVSLLVSGPLGTFARAQQPAPQSAEQPAPQPAEQSVAQPAEQPAPQPAEQPAPQPAEQPAPQPDQPAQTTEPAPQPAEQPMQAAPQPAPQPGQMPAPQPAPETAQQPQPTREMVMREDVESSAPYIMGATIANFVFVPGKAVTCVLGLAVGSGLFLVTLGAGYKGSVAFAKEGCGGKWILTGRDLMGTDWILGTGDRADRN
jgi:hypothetical protein